MPKKQMKLCDTVKLCNCASCDVELLGQCMTEFWDKLPFSVKVKYPEVLQTRINGRPYCRNCAAVQQNIISKLKAARKNGVPAPGLWELQPNGNASHL